MADRRSEGERRRACVVSETLCGVTDIGLLRDRNEDDFAVSGERILIVADGLGGLPAGEVASSTAVAAAASVLAGRVSPTLDPAAAAALLTEAFAAANGAVGERAERDPHCTGMATTLVVALATQSMLAVAHVGDVRVYRLGAGGLERLTEDHTRAWERVRRGEWTEDEAKRSPLRNVLTRVLGFGSVDPSIATFELQPGDVVLLCSDGLWDPVDEKDIEVLLGKRPSDAQSRASALADVALAAGGPDNITAVVYQHS